MARIRTVKPEFFRHEGLQDLEIQNPGKYPMMVFEGLWILCDKSGRFEWKPRQIKLDVLPFLPFDMAETLDILKTAGFVKKYSTGGKDYGIIESFGTHQRIDGKESAAPDRYPSPPEQTRTHLEHTQDTPGTHLESQEKEKEKEKEKERKGVKQKTPLPQDFKISERVKKWASEKGYVNLEQHLESFKLKCGAKDYRYVNWDDALMNAIRDNWAKIDTGTPSQPRASPSAVISCPKCGQRVMKSDLTDTGCIKCMMDEK